MILKNVVSAIQVNSFVDALSYPTLCYTECSLSLLGVWDSYIMQVQSFLRWPDLRESIRRFAQLA